MKIPNEVRAIGQPVLGHRKRWSWELVRGETVPSRFLFCADLFLQDATVSFPRTSGIALAPDKPESQRLMNSLLAKVKYCFKFPIIRHDLSGTIIHF